MYLATVKENRLGKTTDTQHRGSCSPHHSALFKSERLLGLLPLQRNYSLDPCDGQTDFMQDYCDGGGGRERELNFKYKDRGRFIARLRGSVDGK